MKNILQDIPEGKLTPEQEQELATQKDPDALNTLAMASLREGFFYARRCFPSIHDDELLSVCYQALLAAAKNFKPGQISFFGFSKPSIRGALSKYARTKDVVRRGPRETESLPAADEADEEDEPTVPRKSYEPEATMPAFEQIHLMEVWAEVEPLMRQALTPEESMILDLNFRGGLNLREIGELLQRSRASMSLIKIRALKKLKTRLIKLKRFSSEE